MNIARPPMFTGTLWYVLPLPIGVSGIPEPFSGRVVLVIDSCNCCNPQNRSLVESNKVIQQKRLYANALSLERPHGRIATMMHEAVASHGRLRRSVKVPSKRITLNLCIVVNDIPSHYCRGGPP